MPDYLSDEWFARAGELVQSVVVDEPARFPLAITQRVTRRVGDDVVYHVTSRPDGDALRLARGVADGEDVCFATDLATAAAIAAGTLNAQQAFVDGRLVVRGDVERLLLARDLLTRVDESLTALRADTRYPD